MAGFNNFEMLLVIGERFDCDADIEDLLEIFEQLLVNGE